MLGAVLRNFAAADRRPKLSRKAPRDIAASSRTFLQQRVRVALKSVLPGFDGLADIDADRLGLGRRRCALAARLQPRARDSEKELLKEIGVAHTETFDLERLAGLNDPAYLVCVAIDNDCHVHLYGRGTPTRLMVDGGESGGERAEEGPHNPLTIMELLLTTCSVKGVTGHWVTYFSPKGSASCICVA